MLLTLALALQLQDPLALRADTLPTGHDALHHDITLVPGDSGTHIVAQVHTTWRLRSGDPLEVQLDSAFRVVRVLTDGEGERRLARIPFAILQGGGVHIPHRRAAGDTLRTTIRYHGPVRDGLIFRTDSAGRRTIFADNWPDRVHGWIPLVDRPGDKATVDFHVEVDTGVTVVASGLRQKVDTLPRGRALWHFRMTRPIPPYGMVVGIGSLVTATLPPAACGVKCVPLSVVTTPEDSAWAADGPFRRAGEMLDYFSRLVGEFPYDNLAHVQSSTRYGGMENPAAIFYNGEAYRARRLGERVVAHETAHQWFGDAITPEDWHHLWLSEGFASYFAALWVRHANGDSAFQGEMRRLRGTVTAAPPSVIGRPILDGAVRDLMSLLNAGNYGKGAWVLHSLRGLVGDSAFADGIRSWYRTRRDSSVLSADFARVMAEATGQDLDWFFRQALTQAGYPKFDLTWRRHRGRLHLTLRQVQPEDWGVYRLPNLVVQVDGWRVPVSVAGPVTEVVLDGVKRPPREIAVDPEGWWLLEAAVRATK